MIFSTSSFQIFMFFQNIKGKRVKYETRSNCISYLSQLRASAYRDNLHGVKGTKRVGKCLKISQTNIYANESGTRNNQVNAIATPKFSFFLFYSEYTINCNFLRLSVMQPYSKLTFSRNICPRLFFRGIFTHVYSSKQISYLLKCKRVYKNIELSYY